MNIYVIVTAFITVLNALYMPKALCISKALCSSKSSCITKVLCKNILCKNARNKELTKTLNCPAHHHNVLASSLSKNKSSNYWPESKNNNEQKMCTNYQVPAGWVVLAGKTDVSAPEDYYLFKDDKGNIQVKIVSNENDKHPLMQKDLLIIKNNLLKKWICSINVKAI
ncbi:hypothetical protein Xmau_00628 [Xenorhabdus mauleonii]|uniref:Uncharacterized protein n=1 Tax=Xenorhabdus mauleonii TaxID=351675 RepID=A0A1I3JIP4_9GAMM|nr:hypothetical protein [Xenorhabdus mauleonii]PHM46222.1 hypothetical protein Xmau_00628 [Xenorhabdus mauleonii]SFI60119.1 hypothetical protein SAMN05421680_102223 [Xenorhabdus mauleonii]